MSRNASYPASFPEQEEENNESSGGFSIPASTPEGEGVGDATPGDGNDIDVSQPPTDGDRTNNQFRTTTGGKPDIKGAALNLGIEKQRVKELLKEGKLGQRTIQTYNLNKIGQNKNQRKNNTRQTKNKNQQENNKQQQKNKNQKEKNNIKIGPVRDAETGRIEIPANQTGAGRGTNRLGAENFDQDRIKAFNRANNTSRDTDTGFQKINQQQPSTAELRENAETLRDEATKMLNTGQLTTEQAQNFFQGQGTNQTKKQIIQANQQDINQLKERQQPNTINQTTTRDNLQGGFSIAASTPTGQGTGQKTINIEQERPQSVAERILVEDQGKNTSSALFMGEDPLKENNFIVDQGTRTDFQNTVNLDNQFQTEGEKLEKKLTPASKNTLRTLGIAPVAQNTITAPEKDNKNTIFDTQGGFLDASKVSINELANTFEELTGKGNADLKTAKKNNPGIDIYDPKTGAQKETISTGLGVPSRQEFIDRYTTGSDEITTFYESDPGFATAQQTEKTLNNAGINKNAADTFGTAVGSQVAIGADTVQTIKNPGKAVQGAVSAATNPTKVIGEATDRELTPYRNTEERKFQEFLSNYEFGLTVASAGTASSTRLASKFSRIDAPDKPGNTNFDTSDQFQLNDETSLGKPGKDGYTPGELADIGKERIAQEFRGIKGKTDKARQSASNFKNRIEEIALKADPATGIGREKRPGELTSTSLDIVENTKQDVKDFIKGDISPEYRRTTKGKVRVTIPAKKADTTTFANQDRVELIGNELVRQPEDVDGAVSIDPRTKEAIIEKPRNRRDVLKEKFNNLKQDFNERMNTGPIGAGPGALLKKTELQDKTPELSDKDFTGRRIDSQDRRQDVSTDSISDRLVRTRDRDRRTDKTEFNKPEPDTRIDNAFGLAAGLNQDQSTDPLLQQNQDQGQSGFVDEVQKNRQENKQNQDSVLRFESDTSLSRLKEQRNRENRRRRKDDSDRKRRKDRNVDINLQKELDSVFSFQKPSKDSSQSFQFTPTLGGALFGETKELSEKQFEQLNQQSFTGLGQRNVVQVNKNNNADEELKKQLGI